MSGNKNKRSMGKKVFLRFFDFLRTNYKTIIIIMALMLLNVGMVMIRLNDLGISSRSKRSLMIILGMIIVTILAYIILYYARKKKWTIERIYLVLGLMLGAFYCLCMPVGGPPDEQAHFRRIYEITNGRIIQQNGGSELPGNLMEVIRIYKEPNAYYNELDNVLEMASSEQVFFGNPNYVILNYIPQSVGTLLGRMMNLPLIPILILARFLNMICCTLIIYLCIKFIPIMKKVVFLVALFPMTMQLFASVSADGSIICAGMALITYVLYARKGMKRKIGVWDFLLLLILCLALTISKPVYAFLCLILFWIPKERFKNNKYKIGFIIVLGMITLAFVLAKMMSGAPVDSGRFGSNEIQRDLIMHQPLLFLGLVFNNIIEMFDFYWSSIVGRSLGVFSIDIYAPYVMVLAFLFGLLCMEREKMNLPRLLRLYSFGTIILVILGTFGIMFLNWSEPGSTVIEGVQGRYFLPILLLIPMICIPSTGKLEKKELVKPTYLYTILLMVNICAVGIIMASHIA